MRAMTYLIGILAGYVYMKLKEADYKLSLVRRIHFNDTIINAYILIMLYYTETSTHFNAKYYTKLLQI